MKKEPTIEEIKEYEEWGNSEEFKRLLKEEKREKKQVNLALMKTKKKFELAEKALIKTFSVEQTILYCAYLHARQKYIDAFINWNRFVPVLTNGEDEIEE